MKEHPVESGRDNVLINVHALDAAHRSGVKIVYRRIVDLLLSAESTGTVSRRRHMERLSEPTNGPYAQSKRVMMDLGRAYHQTSMVFERYSVFWAICMVQVMSLRWSGPMWLRH